METLLGTEWTASGDIAWTLRSSGDGLEVLAATASSGYAWSPVASLSAAGRASAITGWIGNACMLGDGQSLVVVYGPKKIADSEATAARGAAVAIVNLATAEVTPVAGTTSIAHYNPGCGAGSSFALTSDPIEGDVRTKVEVRDLGSTQPRLERVFDGTVTSPVPYGDGFLAAVSGGLALIDARGAITQLPTPEGVAGIPYDVHLDAEGGVMYAVRTDDGYQAYRIAQMDGGKPQLLARTPEGSPIQLAAGAAGQLVIDAGAGPISGLPAGASARTVSRSQSLSSSGVLLVSTAADAAREAPQPVVQTEVAATGEKLAFGVGDGPERKVEGGEGTGERYAPPPRRGPVESGPLDDGPACAVVRNDADAMAYQPRPRQIEWAVDMAVEDTLTLTRPADWKGNGLASYNVDTLIGHTSLSGGGTIPAQVLLGILAQESNLWQASHAKPGEMGNPLVGNYYGRDVAADAAHPWDIDYAKVDCGYGVSQVTDHMTAADPTRSALEKSAIALDYVANIAEAANILAAKWNETRAAGLTVNNGDPQYIENWYFAIWAYNSGYHPNSGAGPWGVGWGNNPANPHYDAGRDPFLEYDYADAAHPQDWPYQEKVFGFAAYPMEAAFDATTYDVGYSQAWWLTLLDRTERDPAPVYVCQMGLNDCDLGTFTQPNAPGVNDEPPGPCKHQNGVPQYDLECWFHHPITFKDAACDECGRSNLRYDATYGEPADGASFPPNCGTTGLPSGLIVVDDQPSSYVPHSSCATPYTPGGTFTLEMGSASARIDLHQTAGGARGHTWFSHMLNPDDAFIDEMWMRGTWEFPSAPPSGWGRLLVHLPAHGAEAQQAAYVIDTGSEVQTRYVNTKRMADTWVSLGVFQFSAPPTISLDNANLFDRPGPTDPYLVNTHIAPLEEVAWDAVALAPLSSKPDDFVVALGDSYASGEGAGNYSTETDINGSTLFEQNACHRSYDSWSMQSILPGDTDSLGQRSQAGAADLDYHAVQCSGAKSGQVLGFDDPNNADGKHGESNHGEVAQLDAGYLDANTTLVTLSIGGNDSYFAPILTQCIALALIAPIPPPCKNYSIPELPGGSLDVTLPARINGDVRASVVTTLEAIHDRAPNAKILLMGYPKLSRPPVASGRYRLTRSG